MLLCFIPLVCSSGTPVALYGAGKPIRESIESMLQQHVEEIFPLQFVDDLRHQQDMVSRLMDNLRMTDDVSRLYGEVIIDATRASNSPLLRAVRRFFPDAPVMSLNGTASDEKTISVHLYEPFEITRIAKVIYPSPSNGTDTSVARVRSILNKANVTELNAEQGDVAERALYAWRDQDASTPQLERVIASIVPNRTVVIDQTNAVLH
ncbi:hypothetical protein OSTOST_14836 [Ostertagia ostertagi]